MQLDGTAGKPAVPFFKRIQLDEHSGGLDQRTIRLVTGRVDAQTLSEGETPKAVVNLCRAVTFKDRYYGDVKLTKSTFVDMIRNFDENTYGQRVFLDVSHRPDNGSAGEIQKLFLDGNKLRAEVEFTERGVNAVKKDRMVYFSIDYSENYVDPESEEEKGPLLMGAALTNRPRVKHLEAVQLADDTKEKVGCVPDIRNFIESSDNTMKKYLEWLTTRLAELKLSNDRSKSFIDSYNIASETLGDDEAKCKALAESLAMAAKQLAQSNTDDDKPININVELGEKGALTADDVNKLLADREAAAQKKLADDKQTLDVKRKIFVDAIDADEGLKALSEDDLNELKAAADDISAELSDERVRKLADNTIKMGNRLAASQKLAERGFTAPAGTVHVSVDESNSIMQLQTDIDKQLAETDTVINGKLSLTEKPDRFVTKVLEIFDQNNQEKLLAEQRMLANGETRIGDTDLPVGFQRTVIREALSDLNILQVIQTRTDPTAQGVTQIPYEVRDKASSVPKGGRVAEGQPIPFAGVSQRMDMAYINQTKLAMRLSNEVIHFTRASQISWDAWARNTESNARLMRELLVAQIANELQRNSDAYGAAPVVDEAAGTPAAGVVIKTTQFPVVRGHQVYDLEGQAVGNPEHPVVVTMGGNPVTPYDGTGEQTAGIYWTCTSYNSGYFKLVDEAGADAAATGAVLISYSWATNVAKFDTDFDSNTTELKKHLNGLLDTIGDRKAMMDTERFQMLNFMMMSPTLNNLISKAEQFEENSKRPDSGISASGDLLPVKSLPVFRSNFPNIDMGEQRILMGINNTLDYTIAKPYVMGQPVEAVDPTTGKFIGVKASYGEEYSSIKVPTPIRDRLTSILVYSASSR